LTWIVPTIFPIQLPGQEPFPQDEWIPQWNWKVPRELKVSVTGNEVCPLTTQLPDPLSVFRGWPLLLLSHTIDCPWVMVIGALKATEELDKA
jgi:hypothetical protein